MTAFIVSCRIRAIRNALVPMAEEYSRQVADFNAQLTVEVMNMRQQYVEKAAGEMFRFLLGRVDAEKAAFAVESDFRKTEINAKFQEHERNVMLNHQEQMYPFELYQGIANMNASVGGGAGMSTQEWSTKNWNFGIGS